MAADPVRRLRLWSILVIAGVFLAGGVAGAGVYAWLRPARLRPWRPHLPALFDELALTPKQREDATAIFEKHHAAIESIISANFPRVRAEEEQRDRELRAVLTDAQKAKFDEIMARPRPAHRGGGFHKGFPPPGNFPPGSEPTSDRSAGGDAPAPNPGR